jgi:hypothetical protein
MVPLSYNLLKHQFRNVTYDEVSVLVIPYRICQSALEKHYRYLNFNMSRIDDKLLEEHDLVSERLDGLPLGRLQLGLELGLCQTDAHPLPTSAPHRLNSIIKNGSQLLLSHRTYVKKRKLKFFLIN